MASCARCWLQKSIRVVNLLVNIYGVVIIVYSLWLLKKWEMGVSELPSSESNLTKPWFIHACLGVGIGVCLSTLFGHMATKSTNNGSTLFCIYIIFICWLLLLQIAVIVTIFFRINWVSRLSKYIDEYNADFKSFMETNINICRLIVIVALVPQIYVLVLGIIAWLIRGESMNNDHGSYLNIPDFRQSFLVGPNSPIMPRISGHFCCANVLLCNSPTHQNPSRRFFPYIISLFRTHFPSRTREIGS